MPFEHPAREALRLGTHPDRETHPAWALFDPDWYRTRYPDAPAGSDEDLLAWHLDRGQQAGHSPNRWFDEAWQRRAWFGIRALIGSGDVESAFDAWCRGAHTWRAPHWLFDPAEYRRRYPELTDEALAEHGLANRYDHYLKHGAPEHRIAHALFDPEAYLAHLDPAEAEAANPFAHFLEQRERGAPERPASTLFDPDWYRERYPEAARAVAAGAYPCLLAHYLGNETPGGFDPGPGFSEAHYLAQDPGLAEAIGGNGFRDGFDHFLRFGLGEGRSPHPDLDLTWYADQPSVREAIAAGRAADAYRHWLAAGRPRGRPAPEPGTGAEQPGSLLEAYRQKAETILPLFGRHRLDFRHEGKPAVSAVLAVRGWFAGTMMSLASLRAQFHGTIDLILIDKDIPTPGEDAETAVAGASVLRFGAPLHDTAVRDAGLICATAEAVLFLADGIDLAPGAVEAALARLNADPAIGAVGGRLVQPDGTLLDAGGIVWRDGQSQPYLRGASPLAPEANFVRDPDVCFMHLLLVRRDRLTALPDQADGLAGTSHDAADLCARIRAAGHRVVYDPSFLGFLTGPAPKTGPDGQAAFAAAHPDLLAARPEQSPGEQNPAAIARARVARKAPSRVLFVAPTVPVRLLGGRHARANGIVRGMATAGASVTLFPLTPSVFPLAHFQADLPDTVEVLYDRSEAGLASFLADRRDEFDTVWVAHAGALGLVRDALSALGRAIPIVADPGPSEAACRVSRAALLGEPFDETAALDREFRDLGAATRAIAASAADEAQMRPRFAGPIDVLGFAATAAPTPRPFAERTGLLFLGAIQEPGDPYDDGLTWFVENVLPPIERELRWETRLTVAGYIGPNVSLDRFRTHPRVTLRGAMTDLAPLFDSHRVFVAPLRFGAGAPYEALLAAASGLPCVVTPFAAGLLGWSGEPAGAAEAESLAAAAIAPHRDPAAWARGREEALARVVAEPGPDIFAAHVAGLLGLAGSEDGTVVRFNRT